MNVKTAVEVTLTRSDAREILRELRAIEDAWRESSCDDDALRERYFSMVALCLSYGCDPAAWWPRHSGGWGDFSITGQAITGRAFPAASVDDEWHGVAGGPDADWNLRVDSDDPAQWIATILVLGETRYYGMQAVEAER
jgi:hypothetical protein